MGWLVFLFVLISGPIKSTILSEVISVVQGIFGVCV